MRFFAGNSKIYHFYSESGEEFAKAAEKNDWLRGKSQPHVHQTNGLIENKNKIVTMGTVVVLLKARFLACWWNHAAFSWVRV